jgi:hypothetical protein
VAAVPRPGEGMTLEEHRRRGDAVDALFRKMKRRIAEGR